MAKNSKVIPQNYPRIQDERSPFYGCLDDSTLVSHTKKILPDYLKELIIRAINRANQKSSRVILSIPLHASPNDLEKIYAIEGKKLFIYFRKYCGDPASTAHQIYGKHFKEVAVEQFRNRTLQKERMNSGWRYQYLAVDCARHSQRFKSVSDLGSPEADFNAIIEFLDSSIEPLSLYVSIKNRSNTMGGQDWPKAIHALENVAKNDKNRTGPYCCIFGMAMDRGTRFVKYEKKSKSAYSINTEIWLSDYFWPFFSNYSYEEIMTFVLEVLVSHYQQSKLPVQIDIPDPLVDEFGACCRKEKLVDELGRFNDPYQLVNFFCKK